MPDLTDVFPVLVTGLHCGSHNLTESYIVAGRVFPVLVTGLHCGS